MGWWKVEGTEHVIGDGPLDTLSGAVREVVAAYDATLNRRPSRAEWEALLLGVLGAEETEGPGLGRGHRQESAPRFVAM